MRFPTYKRETQKHAAGFLLVAGCDEVGVAPLAGPVVAASVILDPASIGRQRSKKKWWYRVRDSKTVGEKEREELLKFILDHSVAHTSSVVSHETIDEINIFAASLLAKQKSVERLNLKPDFVFLDGRHRLLDLTIPQEAVIGGDGKILSIAAASIVAKVTRDRILLGLHERFPQYGFEKHKGYPTRLHLWALKKFGACAAHRRSFTPVQRVLGEHPALNPIV